MSEELGTTAHAHRMLPLDLLARKCDFRRLLNPEAPMRLNLVGSYQLRYATNGPGLMRNPLGRHGDGIPVDRATTALTYTDRSARYAVNCI